MINHDDARSRATAIMLRSIAEVKKTSENLNGRLKSEQLRACFDILSDALSGRLHQSQQASFTALSSHAIFMFL